LELAAEAIRYGRAANVPVIIDVLDIWPDIYLILLPQLLQPFARLLLRPEFEKARRICRQATAITAVSQTYLDWGLAHAGRAHSPFDQVFPLGCTSLDSPGRAEILTRRESIRAQYGASSDALLATFAGTFGVSYDLQTIARAAAMLDKEQGSRVRFVFAGDGDKGAEVRALTQHLTNVLCTGWIQEAPLRELLHVSSVGLASYTEKALQSLPNKPFEYMAAGLPIVSSLRGELETTIHSERIGRHYRAGDASALAEQLRWCSANPEELQAMSVRARQLFERSYETGKIYGRFVEYLTEVGEVAAQKHFWPTAAVATSI
jgi:glycosyltransferase involved in cell wall biosynthesis